MHRRRGESGTPRRPTRSDPASRDANKRQPFKPFDNVDYVDLHNVSTYLVTTSAGLVLLDAGFADDVAGRCGLIF